MTSQVIRQTEYLMTVDALQKAIDSGRLTGENAAEAMRRTLALSAALLQGTSDYIWACVAEWSHDAIPLDESDADYDPTVDLLNRPSGGIW